MAGRPARDRPAAASIGLIVLAFSARERLQGDAAGEEIDQITLATFSLIVTTLVISIVSSHNLRTQSLRMVRRIDDRVGVASIAAHAGLIAIWMVIALAR
ncbi:hypothetical protein [Consotaella aegiceratis]|uniref:hypothetical protein n=1 Tax=Consotaella aegiceratis TaxID=3097961 RepID=UPI002F40D72E